MSCTGKILSLMLFLTIAALSITPPLVYGESLLNATGEIITPTLLEPAPTLTPLGVISGLVAVTIMTVLLIYMLKRMKTKRPILGL